MSPPTELVGILPAAGHGTRLGALGPRKEMQLVPLPGDAPGAPHQPIVLASLRQMHRAGATGCAVVIGRHKAELVADLGGAAAGVSLAYVVQESARGLADAVASALPWVGARPACLALPDTLIRPVDALARVAARLPGADLVLGVFPTEVPERLGPVRVEGDGTVREVLDKPASTDLRNTWGMAAWSPRFSALLGEAVAAEPGVILGHVFHRAIAAGLTVRAVVFPEGGFLDVGTPDALAAARAT